MRATIFKNVANEEGKSIVLSYFKERGLTDETLNLSIWATA